MLLDEVSEQIKGVFNRVETAISLREALKQPLHQQSVGFVVPVSERPQTNARDVDVGQPLQEVIVTFGVVIGFKSINDLSGSKSMAKLETLRDKLRAKLYGFRPQEHEPILLGASDLIQFVPDGLWWIDRFSTNTYRKGFF